MPVARAIIRPARVLLVSDLHYDLRKLDWVLAQAADVDLLVHAVDVLDAGSPVPLGAQIGVLLEYLERCARQSAVVVCSGYHDLDRRTATGEKGDGMDRRSPRRRRRRRR